MFLQKLLFYVLLFSATLLSIRLTEAVRGDVFFPNERLKELMNLINKKTMILFYVSFYTFFVIGGAYYIISSAPCVMNKDFAIKRGKIQNVSLYEKNNIGTKYNITLLDENGNYNQVEHVFSEALKEGDEVEIAESSQRFLGRIVKTINGKETEYYQSIENSTGIEKIIVCIYIIFTIVMQTRFLKREKKSMSISKVQLLLLQFWEKGVWIYCIIMAISLFNLVDNKIWGITGALVFVIYTFSSFLSLMLEGKNVQNKT
ncbi:hypothetical protein [Dorea sp. D27]|uniref:hypothetical protein n=1 Tax=Dorea sp. D27 TaxID=658665 RepID=UPI00067361EF|nr:hypothetical protein [Dorea sp. D27]